MDLDPFKSYIRLDKYVSRICFPLSSRFVLSGKYYERLFRGITYKVYTIFPLQHFFGDIDIMKKKLRQKDIIVLKQFVLLKKTTTPALLNWPEYFHLVEIGDNDSTKRDKQNSLQDCINIHIDFLMKHVYSSKRLHKVDLSLLIPRLEYIVNLKIIMAKEFN